MTSRDAPSNRADTPSRGERLLIGRWCVDPQLDEIRAGDTVIKLEPRKMQLLVALARRPGELVTTDELFETVWTNMVVTQSSVYQSIAQLRKTLGDHSERPSYIATVPRKGYRLVAPVSALQPAAAAVAQPAAVSAGAPIPQAAAVPPRRMAWSRRAWVATAAASGAAAAAIGVMWWHGRESTPSGPVRLAVLPFGDLSEPPQAALAAGVTDDLQATLERVAGLSVSARSSSLILIAQGEHATAIAQRLGASHFVRGTVRRAAGRLSVAAELVAADSGSSLWSGSFEHAEGDVAELPALVARKIVQALRLTPASQVAALPSTREFAALEAYFSGMQQLRMASAESVRTARDHFIRATELDAGFARAYAGLALAWMAGHDFEGLPLRQVVRYAQPVIDQALALDPDSANAHAVQGYIFVSTLRLADAETHLQRALALNPNYASAQFWRGMAAAFDGRPLDAIPMYTVAGQLDPMNFLVHLLMGHANLDVGQYQVARADIGRARELAPRHPNGARSLGALAYAEGNLAEAVIRYREASELNPKRYDIQRELGWLCLDLGLHAEAAQAFERAIANAPTLPFLIAESGLRARAANDDAALQQTMRRLEQFEPKPLPTGAQAGLAWLHLLRGDAIVADRLADEVAGRIVADPLTLAGPWETFLGQSIHVDLAATFAAAGRHEAVEPLLADVWSGLDRLERNRLAWHSLPFLKARIAALRGDTAAAIALLERAVARGFRRGWWLAIDPAMVAVRASPQGAALTDLVARIEVDVRAQRDRVPPAIR
ncbi:MAG: hypothetical protein LKCHEGNO_01250 [Burkholderiaceae bacterium]|nr:hypothetical protein [Burkholderiaceae bacterium]